MLASIIALPSMKNSFTSVSRLWPFLRDRAWAKMKSWPGGNTEAGPSAQYSALAFLMSSRLAASSISRWMSTVE